MYCRQKISDVLSVRNKAWSYQSRRFWLHTCTKDHPAALPNYLKAGFAVYKEEVKDQG